MADAGPTGEASEAELRADEAGLVAACNLRDAVARQATRLGERVP